MSIEKDISVVDASKDLAGSDERILMHRQLLAAHDYSLRATETWGIEVVKTLFLLNAAGLAGVFALVQAEDIARKDLPFLSFSIGILFAVISLTFGRYMHAAAADGWQASADLYATTFNAKDAALKNLKQIECLEFAQIFSAYGSAACCLWAGYTLYGLFL